MDYASITLLEWLAMLAMIIFAAIVAMIVRAEDDPKTPWTKAFFMAHMQVFIYAILASLLAMFLLGYDPRNPADFVALLAVAYTGLAFVKGIVSRASAEKKE